MHIVVISGFYHPFLIPPVGCLKPFLIELAKTNDVELICPISNNSIKEDLVLDGIKINYIN